MPRAKFIVDPSSPYHLAARSNNRDWFSVPLDRVWTIYSDYLWFIRFAYRIRVHAFVLMNNHFHLIASFPEGNLSDSMNYFMRETSRVIAFESRRINHVYGARIFRSRLSSFHYFQHAYKYVYRNPVEAGLCERVEDYRFSTLNGLLGLSHLLIPIEGDALLFDSHQFGVHLEWLNTSPSAESRDDVRKALMKPSFTLPKLASSRRTHPLESDRY